MPNIDLHAHVILRDALDEMKASHPEAAPELLERDGALFLQYPGRDPLGPVPRSMFSVDERLSDMERQQVDIQLLSVPPPQFYYHVDSAVGSDFARIQNDAMLRTSDEHPDRFHVFPTLPLQDVSAAVRELGRVSQHPRVRGVEIGTHVNQANLDDPGLEPLWTALAEARLPVWIHPDQRGVAGTDRLTSYYLVNLIGNPLESTIAIAALIFGGVLERHADLRFGFVHGGGFAPYQTGRWDHGWGCRTEPKQHIAVPPTTYFKRMFFDSLTHDALSLEMLGRRVGWRQVVLGSDYPFDMASSDPVAAVKQLGLPAQDEAAVLSENAERFLRPLQA